MHPQIFFGLEGREGWKSAANIFHGFGCISNQIAMSPPFSRNPSPFQGSFHDVEWPRYEGQSKLYLEFNDKGKPKARSELFPKRMYLWSRLIWQDIWPERETCQAPTTVVQSPPIFQHFPAQTYSTLEHDEVQDLGNAPRYLKSQSNFPPTFPITFQQQPRQWLQSFRYY